MSAELGVGSSEWIDGLVDDWIDGSAVFCSLSIAHRAFCISDLGSGASRGVSFSTGANGGNGEAGALTADGTEVDSKFEISDLKGALAIRGLRLGCVLVRGSGSGSGAKR